jgi:hypothetical protein
MEKVVMRYGCKIGEIKIELGKAGASRNIQRGWTSMILLPGANCIRFAYCKTPRLALTGHHIFNLGQRNFVAQTSIKNKVLQESPDEILL